MMEEAVSDMKPQIFLLLIINSNIVSIVKSRIVSFFWIPACAGMTICVLMGRSKFIPLNLFVFCLTGTILTILTIKIEYLPSTFGIRHSAFVIRRSSYIVQDIAGGGGKIMARISSLLIIPTICCGRSR
jgi:hypothetical protein